jgi:transcriptional regulator with XRE-family HTH domain
MRCSAENALVPQFARDFLPPDPQAISAQSGPVASPRTAGRPLPGHRVMPDARESRGVEVPPSLAEQLRGMLAETLYEDRKLSLLPQRVLADRSGVPQQSISAYERGRITPSWSTYIKLMLAMNRIPILATRPTPASDGQLGEPEDRLLDALVAIKQAVGDRPYAISHRGAAHLHGLPMTAERVIAQGMAVRVAGRPDRLDEFAQELSGLREIRTARGPAIAPHLSFDHAGIDIALFIREDIGASVQLSLGGETFSVVPLDRVLVF